MANVEQLAILRQGWEVWNEWRENHFNPDFEINLTGADLKGTDLGEVNLSEADLYKANLSKAILSRANLSSADLSKANLYQTDLSGADLRNANLSGANLSEANLYKADLSEADLSDADLDDANLSRANFTGVDLSAIDLNRIDLSEAILIQANLSGADLSETNLYKIDLYKADLRETNFIRADLREADLSGADLSEANLYEANLSGANFSEADLSGTNLREANLNGANLSRAILIETNFEEADITGCHIFGISAWKLKIENLTQSNLIITERGEPEITVDNIEVAQFVYLLLHNEKIRDVITTIGQKAVLILGRFALPERKVILEAMRNKLREKGYLPIVFDFEKSAERDFTETIQVLAGMCLFVIADITNPKSSPLELQAVVPNYMIPFAPIIQGDEEPFSMFRDLQHKYPWMMKVRTYNDEADLIANFEKGIIHPALKRHDQLIIQKNKALEMLAIGDDDEDEDE